MNVLKYDIRERPFVFESTLLYHANTPHALGTRYSVVMYNKDTRWASDKQPIPKRTHVFADTKSDLSNECDAYYLDQTDVNDLENVRSTLLHALTNTTFTNDRCSGGAPHSKYPDIQKSKFISFGNTLCRKSRAHQAAQGIDNRRGTNPNNAKHPTLFNALCAYLNTFQTGLFGVQEECAYTSLIITQNAMCRFHLDTSNFGNACILAFGDYSNGGELLVDIGKSNFDL
jgi:hypothetical protein